MAALAVLEAMQLSSRSEDSLAQIASKLPDTKVRDAIVSLSELPKNMTASQAATITGNSGYAPESVPLAVFIAVTANDLEEGVLSAVGCGGDTDTIASMVGHILGAQGPAPCSLASEAPLRAIQETCKGLD